MTITDTEIYYSYDIAANDYMRVRFKNEPDGPNSGSTLTRYYGNDSGSFTQAARDPRTYQYSLKQYIDPTSRPDPTDTEKLVIYEGQQSGTTGAGNLNVIKEQAEVFPRELPDAIVATHKGGYESILRLKFARNITDQPDGRNFWYEARVTTGTSDYIIVFTDDKDGSFKSHGGETDNFPADGSMDQSLTWFIENGRAIYYGSIVPESTVGNLEEVKDKVPLANVIKLPDALIDFHNNEIRTLYFEKVRVRPFFSMYHKTPNTTM